MSQPTSINTLLAAGLALVLLGFGLAVYHLTKTKSKTSDPEKALVPHPDLATLEDPFARSFSYTYQAKHTIKYPEVAHFKSDFIVTPPREPTSHNGSYLAYWGQPVLERPATPKFRDPTARTRYDWSPRAVTPVPPDKTAARYL